jgi:hypothetical protein
MQLQRYDLGCRQRAISLQTANDAVAGVRDQETARGIEGQCCGSP